MIVQVIVTGIVIVIVQQVQSRCKDEEVQMHGNADAEQAHRRRGEEVVQGCRGAGVQSGAEW